MTIFSLFNFRLIKIFLVILLILAFPEKSSYPALNSFVRSWSKTLNNQMIIWVFSLISAIAMKQFLEFRIFCLSPCLRICRFISNKSLHLCWILRMSRSLIYFILNWKILVVLLLLIFFFLNFWILLDLFNRLVIYLLLLNLFHRFWSLRIFEYVIIQQLFDLIYRWLGYLLLWNEAACLSLYWSGLKRLVLTLIINRAKVITFYLAHSNFFI